ncbi:endonuclease V [Haloarcula nitratireducens]|uniref:Endonuclease V n=1 Tax=Haloarcula nitratireducens TaxID=2487749 RepID=A0AAW4P6W0_9EURY|nr:endonuclease V [Halomicroarcula nitratireducens]MBX0293612.1 endonuclease V [Halomicroarcula nitratireducens]
MEVTNPTFVPDPSLSTAEMEDLQREIAATAVFEDDHDFDPDAVALDGPAEQATLGEIGAGSDGEDVPANRPLVAGVDQAFVGDRAVSAIVVLRGREVIERVYAVEPAEIPYVPGLLSFREGGAILSAFSELDSDPDVVFVDGSGRIHYREAGLATHVGVTLNVPTVGVAKNLLCGTPREPLDRKLPTGTRVPIEADEEVETAAAGTLIGYAVQTRQYESSKQHINPLIVSPGHRVSAGTAADLVSATAGGYKLPEPTRLADKYADDVKAEI